MADVLPGNSPMFEQDVWHARHLLMSIERASNPAVDFFPEDVVDQVLLDESPIRILHPLPIYEDCSLVLPLNYPSVLPHSIVRVELYAVHHYDKDLNQESFYFDVQELIVLRRKTMVI